MATIQIQEESTSPPLRFQLVEGDDATPISLTGLSVKLRWAKRGEQALWERDCTVDEAAAGRCHYSWQEGDLANSGSYEAQPVIVIPGSPDTYRFAEVVPVEVLRSIPEP